MVNLPSPLSGLGCMVACGITSPESTVVYQLVAPHHHLPWYHRALGRWMLRRGQRWVAVSEDNAKLLAEIYNIDVDRLDVVYNGSPLVDTDPDRQGSAAIREELQVSDNAKVCISVGALTHQKGHDVLLQAMKTVMNKHPDAVLYIVGEGGLRERYEQSIRSLGLEEHVFLLGRRTDVPELLRLADLFIFPSRFEGFPFALVEAMQTGLAVVTTNVSSMPEVITDGVEGLLVPPESPDELADACNALLSDREKSDSYAKASALRAATFTEQAMLEGVEKIITRTDKRTSLS